MKTLKTFIIVIFSLTVLSFNSYSFTLPPIIISDAEEFNVSVEIDSTDKELLSKQQFNTKSLEVIAELQLRKNGLKVSKESVDLIGIYIALGGVSSQGIYTSYAYSIDLFVSQPMKYKNEINYVISYIKFGPFGTCKPHELKGIIENGIITLINEFSNEYLRAKEKYKN